LFKNMLNNMLPPAEVLSRHGGKHDAFFGRFMIGYMP